MRITNAFTENATSKMLSAKSAKMCSKAFLLFAQLMCASLIFNKRQHVLAKLLLPKAALLDWSAPGLRVDIGKIKRNIFFLKIIK